MSASRTDELAIGQTVQMAVITRTVESIQQHRDGSRTVTWTQPTFVRLVNDPTAERGIYHQARLWVTTLPEPDQPPLNQQGAP